MSTRAGRVCTARETIRLTVNGRRVYAMIYIMNEQGHPYGKPSSFYLNTICEGYQFLQI